MKRTGYLFEKIADFHRLYHAARRAAKGKQLSHEASVFLLNLEKEVLNLKRELDDGSYQPRPYRTFEITDPKPRTISAAAFRDRVVHHALCAVIEPTLERYAIYDSYACRVGKGGLAAIKRAQQFSRRFAYFLKLDVHRFFETADHDVLKRQLGRLIKDRRCLALCNVFIDAGAPGSQNGKGLPIGNLTSQHFANFYLGSLDHYIKEDLGVRGYCRYMDDLLLFGYNSEELANARDEVRAFVEQRLLLRLKESATMFAPVFAGVSFLGFRIWPRQIRLDPFRARRFRVKVRRRFKQLSAREIGEAAFCRSLTSLCGWVEQADTYNFRKSFFERL